MKKYLIFLTFLILGCTSSKKEEGRRIASLTQTGSLDFCHINPSGYRQCNYSSLEKCHKARRYLEGICTKNDI